MPYNPAGRSEIIHPSRALPGITVGIIVSIFIITALVSGVMIWFLCRGMGRARGVAGEVPVAETRAVEDVAVVEPGIYELE